jgi:hypothetical protein
MREATNRTTTTPMAMPMMAGVLRPLGLAVCGGGVAEADVDVVGELEGK